VRSGAPCVAGSNSPRHVRVGNWRNIRLCLALVKYLRRPLGSSAALTGSGRAWSKLATIACVSGGTTSEVHNASVHHVSGHHASVQGLSIFNMK